MNQASEKEEGGKIWHKVTMSVAKGNSDMVRSAMQALSSRGIQSEDEGKEREHLEAYFDDAIDAASLKTHMELIAALVSAAGGRKLQVGAIETVPEEDWAEEWRRNWKPIKITEKLIICPSWQKYPASGEQTVIYIYPRMAFGTGSHPTTQLCLKLLEAYLPADASVIDIGSGSGILAIAAAKLGARRVTAVEKDKRAIENARENCKFNRVQSKVKIDCDWFGPRLKGKFDLGLCNMLGHEMLPLVTDITRVLRGKSLIASGLTQKPAAEIKKEMARRGWRIRKTLRKGEWHAFYATHQAV